MVRLLLSIKADLENVTNLLPATADHEFFFQVKCNSCHETHSNFVALNRLEEHEVSGGKGNKANFVWRCGFCKREHTAKFEQSSPIQPYTSESNGTFAPFLTLDCRGLEFIGFDARGMWKCEGIKSGTKFSNVDLDDGGEWVDYDEKDAVPVSVMAVEGQWSRA
ncbi:DUF866-domain-containing protein [Hysterangium stoloniferum]|nr:DUF866-domain-containing protein [Hysterangium stoloniferum]